MVELDTVANMCTIVDKLPYKLKEKLSKVAFDIQNKDKGQAKSSASLTTDRRSGKSTFITTATPVLSQR